MSTKDKTKSYTSKGSAVTRRRRRRSVTDDVLPSTSLPPCVDGPLKCFVRVCISNLRWLVPTPQDDCQAHVRLQWWGETPSSFTVFRPTVFPKTTIKFRKQTTSKFPVKCSSKQLIAYFRDMSSVVLDVVIGPSSKTVGRCHINTISHLSEYNPIKGAFPVFSGDGYKVADISASFSIVSLNYTSSASGTETSLDLSNAQSSVVLASSLDASPLVDVNQFRDVKDKSKQASPRAGMFQREKCVDFVQSKQLPSPSYNDTAANVLDKHYRSPAYTNPQYFTAATHYNESESKSRHNLISILLDKGSQLQHLVSPADRDRDLFTTGEFNAYKSPSQYDLPKGATLINSSLSSGYSFSDNESSDPNPLAILNDAVSGKARRNRSVGEMPRSRSKLNKAKRGTRGELVPHHPSSTDEASCDSDVSLCINSSSSSLIADDLNASVNSSDNEGIIVERLAVLSKVSLAKVSIDTLKLLRNGDALPSPRAHRKGKPPRPKPKSSYVLQYSFPTSNTEGRSSLETVTFIGKQVKRSSTVVFDHSGSFSVSLSGNALRTWWKSAIKFKVYIKSRSPNSSAKLGTGLVFLRPVILDCNLKRFIDVDVFTGGTTGEKIGTLKVSIQLESDDRKFPNLLAKMQMAEKPDAPSPLIISVNEIDNGKSLNSELKNQRTPAEGEVTRLEQGQRVKSAQDAVRSPLPLHMYLSIPAGSVTKAIQANCYIVCKLSLVEDDIKSVVCWGTNEPNFRLLQVLPITIDEKTLLSCEDNFMVIEMWNKATMAEEDRIVGIVKVSLHQFYLSFKSRQTAETLLGSVYPVLASDIDQPIVNLFTNEDLGSLNVVFAIGTQEQINNLHQAKCNGSYQTKATNDYTQSGGSFAKSMNEHEIEINIEGLRGLNRMGETLWGESDCYIIYYIPEQQADVNYKTINSPLSIKAKQTATTLSMPNATFNHVSKHKYMLESGQPLQNSLTSAHSVSGNAFTFELWCRYYYPNVRDILIAKCQIPVSKVCALVTMNQLKSRMSASTFALPLVAPGSADGCGTLDIVVKYRKSKANPELLSEEGIQRDLGDSATISVTVSRACGLQAAAREAALVHNDLQYASDVGVNSYVKISLSYLSDEEHRCTRTIARSFTPSYYHTVDFTSPITVSNKETFVSLAELLESSYITLEVYHQTSDSDPESLRNPRVIQNPDYLLGVCTIPLSELLLKSSGIKGWYAVNSAPYCHPLTSERVEGCNALGVLELSAKFANESDREIVSEAGRHSGWSPTRDLSLWAEETRPVSMEFHVNIKQVYFPEHLATAFKQPVFHQSTRCYARYKLFDRDATLTKHFGTNPATQGVQVCRMNVSNKFNLPVDSQLIWYLAEEALEIQFWVKFGTGSHRDKLIGSCCVQLLPLATSTRCFQRIVELIPLHRSDQPDMFGAAADIELVMQPGKDSLTLEKEIAPQDDKYEVDCREQFDDVERSQNIIPDSETFSATIFIDRALHLPYQGEFKPSSYISFQSKAENRIYKTEIICDNSNPVWEYQVDVRLPLELLSGELSLVLKIWQVNLHKNDKSCYERVLGFTSFDLSPLTSGFHQLSGWYNITDFSGKSHGQVKLSLTPDNDMDNIAKIKQYERIQKSYTKAPTHVSIYSELKETAVKSFTSGVFNTAMPTASILGNETSESLREVLSKNLQDLDNITARMRGSLAGKIVPEVARVEYHSSPVKDCGEFRPPLLDHSDVCDVDLCKPLNFQSELQSDPSRFASIMARKDYIPQHPMVRNVSKTQQSPRCNQGKPPGLINGRVGTVSNEIHGEHNSITSPSCFKPDVDGTVYREGLVVDTDVGGSNADFGIIHDSDKYLLNGDIVEDDTRDPGNDTTRWELTGELDVSAEVVEDKTPVPTSSNGDRNRDDVLFSPIERLESHFDVEELENEYLNNNDDVLDNNNDDVEDIVIENDSVPFPEDFEEVVKESESTASGGTNNVVESGLESIPNHCDGSVSPELLVDNFRDTANDVIPAYDIESSPPRNEVEVLVSNELGDDSLDFFNILNKRDSATETLNEHNVDSEDVVSANAVVVNNVDDKIDPGPQVGDDFLPTGFQPRPPNFFIPSTELVASMRMLSERSHTEGNVPHNNPRRLPSTGTADEAKRIAKIFNNKLRL